MRTITLVLVSLATASIAFPQDKAGIPEPSKQALTQKHVQQLRQSAISALIEKAPATGGFSYANIIPYVTNQNGRRTNLGLNNFSPASFAKGIANPSTEVLVGLVDPQGNISGSGTVIVRANELLQVNDIISALGGTVGTGYLLIFSDEPLTAWASVIENATNDPSIELAIPFQLFKPSAYIQGEAWGFWDQRLLMQSSVKLGNFQSSLYVVNTGAGGGTINIRIYDAPGNLIQTLTPFIPSLGMYINEDIRSGVNGTFGQIIIEPTTDLQILSAVSLVNSTSGNGAFFPAFALMSKDRVSIGGVWEGSITGGLINAQVKVELHEEGSMLYGSLEILSGSFPTTNQGFVIGGEAFGSSGLGSLSITDWADTDGPGTFVSMRMIGGINSSSTSLTGTALYLDGQQRQDVAAFTLIRTGEIFSTP